ALRPHRDNTIVSHDDVALRDHLVAFHRDDPRPAQRYHTAGAILRHGDHHIVPRRLVDRLRRRTTATAAGATSTAAGTSRIGARRDRRDRVVHRAIRRTEIVREQGVTQPVKDVPAVVAPR